MKINDSLQNYNLSSVLNPQNQGQLIEISQKSKKLKELQKELESLENTPGNEEKILTYKKDMKKLSSDIKIQLTMFKNNIASLENSLDTYI
jgi:hypothetical protein